MSWRAVARNDLRGAFATRGVWVLTAGLLALLAGMGYAVPRLAGSPETPFSAYLDVLVAVAVPLFPLLGLVLGYRAVVAARDSGTAALALSLPNSRRDLVVGKLLARAAALAGALGVAGLAAGGYLFVSYGEFAAGEYLLVLLATYGYTLAFLGIAVGLSTGVTSPRRVIGTAFGAYVLLAMLWGTLIDAVMIVLFRFSPPMEAPTWVEFAKFVEPGTSLSYLLASELGVGTAPPAAVVGTEPFVSAAGALTALLAWLALPVVLGYARFQRDEL
ncbi:ABC transporter permease subunit [Halolamina sp. CBA1230]|uniref:ABC transporter permease n=1 Tax=Halolamina sp. CBA1230 TaxID=1853690 RepID=UPI0009A15DD0|nr:ABC transporter permease subunit [Halolamina sp. CBA1230]QKY19293.1 ABC transporter permease subunit [Halolamina sp. CBA1230]